MTSAYEWRRPRGALNRRLEKLEDIPWNLLSRRGLRTNSAKRALWEDGIPGRAQILERPRARDQAQGQAEGEFRFFVHVEGREPYEVANRQSYSGYEWDLLGEGAVVECRVDPRNPARVLLCAPEPG